MRKIEFTKEQLAFYAKVSREVLEDFEQSIGTDGDDFIHDQFTYRINAWFLSHLSETQTVTHFCDRPKFLDWLLRRKKTITIKIDVKDLLLNPPILKDKTIRTYDIAVVDPSKPTDQDVINAVTRQVNDHLNTKQ